MKTEILYYTFVLQKVRNIGHVIIYHVYLEVYW